MDYNSALEELLSNQTIEDYLAEDAVMSVTVASENDSQSSEILQKLKSIPAIPEPADFLCHRPHRAERAPRPRSVQNHYNQPNND